MAVEVATLTGAAVVGPTTAPLTTDGAHVATLAGAAIVGPVAQTYPGTTPRLPTNVEAGATGGPAFNTTVLELSNGAEQRNQNWSQPLHSWDIAYGIRSKVDLIHIITFFNARRGRLHPFRFRDWADYECDGAQFGTGDGSTVSFQLAKTYTSGGVSFTRRIRAPAVVDWILVNGAPASYALNWETGIVTFDTAPLSGAVLAWAGEFDCNVRFDTDQLNVSMEIFDAGMIPSIPIKEVRE